MKVPIEIMCIAWPNDGDDQGDPVASDPLIISNTLGGYAPHDGAYEIIDLGLTIWTSEYAAPVRCGQDGWLGEGANLISHAGVGIKGAAATQWRLRRRRPKEWVQHSLLGHDGGATFL